MNNVVHSIRAHFDGKVIVPDEPADLPADVPLEVAWKPLASPSLPDGRLKALERLLSRVLDGPALAVGALRREHLYADER
jgi:hypothetical protein